MGIPGLATFSAGRRSPRLARWPSRGLARAVAHAGRRGRGDHLRRALGDRRFGTGVTFSQPVTAPGLDARYVEILLTRPESMGTVVHRSRRSAPSRPRPSNTAFAREPAASSPIRAQRDAGASPTRPGTVTWARTPPLRTPTRDFAGRARSAEPGQVHWYKRRRRVRETRARHRRGRVRQSRRTVRRERNPARGFLRLRGPAGVLWRPGAGNARERRRRGAAGAAHAVRLDHAGPDRRLLGRRGHPARVDASRSSTPPSTTPSLSATVAERRPRGLPVTGPRPVRSAACHRCRQFRRGRSVVGPRAVNSPRAATSSRSPTPRA